MSDLPPPAQSLRTALSIHAVIAAAIMIVVAVAGRGFEKALGIAALYFVLAGGWSGFRMWKAARDRRARESVGEHRR